MSYNTTRQDLIKNELDERAERFAASYDPTRPSVILLPGGMGSRLFQTVPKYVDDAPFPDPVRSRKLWLSFASIFRGELVQLRMTKKERDAEGKLIFARGELNDLAPLVIGKRYDQTAAFFKPWANYTGMGYDWRHSPQAAAGYLRLFLDAIRRKVKARFPEADPLPNLTLLAHSMGGLVIKLFINDLLDHREDPKSWFKYFISVATPFYGTYTHMPRYYAGVGLLNLFMGGGAQAAELVSTLPGPYILMPAPQSVLAPRLDDLNLLRYPVRDLDRPNQPADPFDQDTRARFPAFMNKRYFSRATRVFKALDRPVPQAQDQIFHIRANDRPPPDPTQPGPPLEVFWQEIDGAAFDLGSEAPIAINDGAGDGTVPFWSARLATTPADHVVDLERQHEEDLPLPHGELLEIDLVLNIVKQIMKEGKAPARPVVPAAEGAELIASRQEVEQWLHTHEASLDDEVTLIPLLADAAPEIRRGLEREADIRAQNLVGGGLA